VVLFWTCFAPAEAKHKLREQKEEASYASRQEEQEAIYKSREEKEEANHTSQQEEQEAIYTSQEEKEEVNHTSREEKQQASSLAEDQARGGLSDCVFWFNGSCTMYSDEIIVAGMCFELREPCGSFEAGERLWTAGQTYDGLVLLVDVRHTKSVQCTFGILRLREAEDCPPRPGYSGVADLLMLTVYFVNACLVIAACGADCGARDGNDQAKNCFYSMYVTAFWVNDLLAGLFATLLAELTFNAGSAWTPGSIAAGLFVAQVLEFIHYDMPMMIAKCCGSGCCFVTTAAILGSLYGSFAIMEAYNPLSVAVVGHHALLLGFFNFLLDFVKHVIKNNLQIYVRSCGEADESEYSADKPLITELTSVVPEHLRTKAPMSPQECMSIMC